MAWVDARNNVPHVAHRALAARGFLRYRSSHRFTSAACARSMAKAGCLPLINISAPTRLGMTSYAVFCLKKNKYDLRPYLM